MRVDLAHEADFALGEMHVSPSAGRVRLAGLDERLEPRVMQVLVVLARAGGATVTRDELIEACWDGRIVSDDAIARIIAKVRSLTRDLDPAPFVLETFPKIGFRLVAGEPPVDAQDPPSPTPTLRPGRTQARAARPQWAPYVVAAAILLLLAVGAIVLWRSLPLPGRPAGQNGRVEVMAFEARQPDPALTRLAASTPEAVVRALSNSGVETASRLGRPDVGESASDAEFRITGSVDREGDKYATSLQLLDRRSGVVVWTQRLDRPVQAAAGFEDEVANGAAAALSCAFHDRKVFRRPMEPATFGLYINACASNYDRMLAYANRLVRAAPDEGGAHAMLAIAQAGVITMDSRMTAAEIEAIRTRSRASARRALELNPRAARAHIALANAEPSGRWAQMERHLLNASEVDPSLTPGRIMYLNVLRQVGRLQEALEIAERARSLGDPRMHSVRVPLTFLHAQSGDMRGARARLDEAWRDNPRLARDLDFTVTFWWDDPATARRNLVRLGSGERSGLDLACFDRHLAAIARRRVVRGLEADCATVDSDWRVRMLARQGDVDGAYAEAANPTVVNQRSTIFLFYPEMKAFRADPRFMPFAARLGLVDYWRNTGHWPDFCSEPDLPYDCKAVARTLAARSD